jgi:RNA polymerase sigma factor (sigma-70 family)
VNERDYLADRFEANRSHLRAVAYRMLGSPSEADDAVQEAWLRLDRSDTGDVENLGGWLTTVVARVCLDALRSRRSRREEALSELPDARSPEPVVGRAQDGADPEREALVADGIGPALLVVLETLSPAERVAFVLHDVFALPFGEIAPILERSPEAAKMLASRARRKVRGETAAAGAVWAPGGRPRVAFGFKISGGRIVETELVADPERLRRLDLTILDG